MPKHFSTSGPLKGAFFIFIFLLFSIAASASSDWTQLQKYSYQAGFQDPTYYNFFLSNFSVTSATLTGTDYQPLAGDVDNDGSMEMVYTSGNYLEIYKVNSAGVLLLDNEIDLGAAQYGQHWMGDTDSDGFMEIAVPTNKTIFSIQYNGSSFNESTLKNASVDAVESGISCDNFAGTYGCYIAGANGTVIEFSPNTGVASWYNITGPVSVFRSWYGKYQSPVISDYDNDGVKELVFSALNYTAPTSQPESILSVSQSGMTRDLYVPGDALIGAVLSDIAGILVYNVDGSANSEICVTSLTHTTAKAVSIRCIKSNGQLYGNWSAPVAVSAYWSNPVMADIDNDADYDICAFGRGQTTGINLVCLDPLTFTVSKQFASNLAPASHWSILSRITSADISGDGNDDILAGNNIFISNSTNFTLYNFTRSLDTDVIPIDISGDGLLDVCGMSSASSFCSYISYSNAKPTLTKSFGRSYDNPVCNNTQLQFSAAEYDESGAVPAGKNYYNDVDTDTERIGVDCFGNGSITNGSYSLANPTAICHYVCLSSQCTYYAKIYLQDSANPNDYTQAESVSILVIPGVPGSTCNEDSVPLGEESLNATSPAVNVNPTTQGVETFLDYLTGGDDDSKLFIGFMLWIIIVVAVGMGIASITHSGAAVAIMCGMTGVITFIVLTALGLLPVWLLILVFLFIAVTAVIVLGLMKAGG